MNEYFIAQHLITARVSDVDNIGLTYYTFTQLVGQLLQHFRKFILVHLAGPGVTV